MRPSVVAMYILNRLLRAAVTPLRCLMVAFAMAEASGYRINFCNQWRASRVPPALTSDQIANQLLWRAESYAWGVAVLFFPEASSFVLSEAGGFVLSRSKASTPHTPRGCMWRLPPPNR